jgi:hypothetical protein
MGRLNQTAGLAGLAGRRSMRHGLRMLTACDGYARVLARSSDRCHEASPEHPDSRRLLAALHSLRQVDRAVINAAIDLGADNGVLLTNQISDVEA